MRTMPAPGLDDLISLYLKAAGQARRPPVAALTAWHGVHASSALCAGTPRTAQQEGKCAWTEAGGVQVDNMDSTRQKVLGAMPFAPPPGQPGGSSSPRSQQQNSLPAFRCIQAHRRPDMTCWAQLLLGMSKQQSG